jgi:hypothetical protein
MMDLALLSAEIANGIVQKAYRRHCKGIAI